MGDAASRPVSKDLSARRVIGCCALLIGLTQPLLAQAPDKILGCHKTARHCRPASTSTPQEGTWMSTDITCRWTVDSFQSASHIYRRARDRRRCAECLTQNSGIAVNFHPRISPDGKTIEVSFNRNGQSNLWLMDLNGAHPRPVTSDTNASATWSRAWSPDGRFLVARKIDAQKLLDVSIVMVHRDGGQGTLW